MFKAVLIEKDESGYRASLKELEESQLPEEDVTVRVAYSTLNYKDALAIAGQAPIVRRFPLVPGVDLAGIVEQSASPEFSPGDAVLLNGCGVGERYWGGLAQKARLRPEWLIPLSKAYTARQAMALGTAGYTAMLCVMALEEQGVSPESGEVAVTGANGGVGTVAVALLSRLGYRVSAITGRPEEAGFLRELGAAEVLPRAEFSAPGKPLGKSRWAGAVDVVGSHTLANLCATMRHGGVVVACGRAAGMDFPATVAPFILRAVRLIGIDAVQCPRALHVAAWERLGRELEPHKIELLAREIGLSETISASKELLEGRIRGRVVVDVNR